MGYPLPLVKEALLSGMNSDDSGKVSSMYLDGYNNPGFSGGPVVRRDYSKAELTYSAVGVISGFVPEIVMVMEPIPIASPEKASDKAKAQGWRIQRKADGSFFEYRDTDHAVPLNTGIVTVCPLRPAIELIRAKHASGPEEKSIQNIQNLK